MNQSIKLKYQARVKIDHHNKRPCLEPPDHSARKYCVLHQLTAKELPQEEEAEHRSKGNQQQAFHNKLLVQIIIWRL